jgi:hypothetical protein
LRSISDGDEDSVNISDSEISLFISKRKSFQLAFLKQ